MIQEKKRLTPIERIEKINQQILKLKLQQQNVQKTFESKITTLLKKEKVYNHDFTILYGAILDICEKLNDQQNNKEQLSHWEKMGSSALEKKKKTEKSELNDSQISSDSDDSNNRKTLKPKYSVS